MHNVVSLQAEGDRFRPRQICAERALVKNLEFQWKAMEKWAESQEPLPCGLASIMGKVLDCLEGWGQIHRLALGCTLSRGREGNILRLLPLPDLLPYPATYQVGRFLLGSKI